MLSWQPRPYRLNERLAIQRGVFLCPGDVSRDFLDNLSETGNFKRLEIEIPPNCRQDVRQLLLRLNINSEVLFPGLQGLAMSLNDRLLQLHQLVDNGEAYVSWIGRSFD
jgi:hypothetical protein